MKRSSPIKRKRGLRRVSARQIAFEDELNALRSIVNARSHLMCEARLDGCLMKAEMIHHKLRRAQGGTNDLSNLLAVCRECHQRIHANVSQSYDSGLLLRRNA